MAHLPHLSPFVDQPIVFVTTVTRDRAAILANEQSHGVLREIWTSSAERNGWFVGGYVVMPDDIHLFARPALDSQPLAVWIRLWKSLSALRFNRERTREKFAWQPDYFDRFLRSADDYSQKWDYVAANPVRKGLVACAADWPYSGVIHDLRF